MPRSNNTITPEQLDEIAGVIARHIVDGKSPNDIARIEQDEIDAKLFPLMQQLEDKIDERLAKIIEEVFEKNAATLGSGNWWDE